MSTCSKHGGWSLTPSLFSRTSHSPGTPRRAGLEATLIIEAVKQSKTEVFLLCLALKMNVARQTGDVPAVLFRGRDL